MELLSALAEVVIPVFVVMALGFAWDRSGRSFEQKMVTDLVVLIGTPCLMFNAITGTAMPTSEMGKIAIAALICPLLTALAAWLVIRHFRLNLKVYLPALTFPNVGNMGLPVCLFAFGQSGLAVAIIYLIVTNVLQFTFGPAIASGQADIRKALTSPILLACYISFGFRFLGLAVPVWVNNGVTLLAGMVIPLMLLSLGVALSRFRVPNFAHTLAFSALRLGLGIGIGWAVVRVLGFSHEVSGTVIVESSMPVAVFNYLYAEMYGNEPHEVAGMVLVSTFLSALSLPILVALLR